MRVRPRTRLQIHSGNDIHRWTVSLADFMTLMFAVFVVLYAVSVSNKEKYTDVMLSIQNASQLLNQSLFSSYREGILTKNSNSIVEDAGPAMLSEGMVNQANDELAEVDTLKAGWELRQLELELESLFAAELDNELIKLDHNGDWLTIEMGGNLLFVAGSHSLLVSAKAQLEKLAKVLEPVNNLLRIRGYTDQETISNEIYLSNWELAGARAFTVLHALNKLGIAGKRMVMEAYGEYYPVINEQGEIDKIKSRRVVIAISKYTLPEEIAPKVKEKPLTVDKNNNSQATISVKPDSAEMHELHLPNNRLIITTRQK